MNNEENYAAFSKDPDRIEGSIHNTATVRLGIGFNFQAMESVDAIEIAFANEPHGNMRSDLGGRYDRSQSLAGPPQRPHPRT